MSYFPGFVVFIVILQNLLIRRQTFISIIILVNADGGYLHKMSISGLTVFIMQCRVRWHLHLVFLSLLLDYKVFVKLYTHADVSVQVLIDQLHIGGCFLFFRYFFASIFSYDIIFSTICLLSLCGCQKVEQMKHSQCEN